MDVRKNALIILISLAIGGLITYWLYTKYHILFFVVFIPIIGFGGGLISRMFRQIINPQREEDWYRPGDDFKDFEEGFPTKDKMHKNKRSSRKLLQQGGYLPPYDESYDESPDDR